MSREAHRMKLCLRGVGLSVFAMLTLGVGSSEPVVVVVPFEGWVAEDTTRIHIEPKRSSRIIGGLSRGDVVNVVECIPSCGVRSAFVRIEPFGYVRLQDLGRGPRPAAEAELHPDASIRFVRALSEGAVVRAEPSERGRPIGRYRSRDEIVLVGDARLDAPGFYRRAGGGYIAMREVRPLTPSTFAGTESPTLPLAFVRTATQITGGDGSLTAAVRYERFHVLGEDEDTARIAQGTLPRESVRIARARTRPDAVPSGAKWVHVSINEQTLVAYEGDTPVFATLVSTGAFGHFTHQGLHTVWQKTRIQEMNGTEEGDRYRVEAVQNVMFFHRDLALHTAYWHDRFGLAVSHGCVNLSPADSRRMFAWAPPEIPSGFRTVYPDRLNLAPLYVLVTR